MSEKRVKALRKMMYGDGTPKKELRQDPKTKTLYADSARQRYQMAKGRKATLPKMGRIRIVAKRPRVANKSIYTIKGAFGKVNRLASIQIKRTEFFMRRSKR